MFKQIPVFFHLNQVSTPETGSPSPRKPGLVVTDWHHRRFPIRAQAPAPVSRGELAAAHDPAYVDGVLDLQRADGFGNCRADVAASFPWTCASFLDASRAALANGQVAVSPTSGFHHAGYAFGGGYCTFNGLMVAAISLLRDGAVRRIGILDCDQHYGNGTEDIIDRLKLREQVRHVTVGQGYMPAASGFLAALPGIVAGFADCDLLMYQAGADPHVDDPLGGYLTTEQLLERDRIVFRASALLGIPVVWNLAGGYQEPLRKVLDIHANTMQACVEAYYDPSEDPIEDPIEDEAAEPYGQPLGAQM